MTFRILAALLVSVLTLRGAYDPLRVAEAKIESKTFDMKDTTRDRVIPVRIYLPATSKPAPVILFSHGLGGSRDNNPYLGNHWAARGYVVVFIQHTGSDEAVWKNAPLVGRMGELKKAASLENLVARGKDIPAVIDTLTAWNADRAHPLYGRMDLSHLGMSGHSFGAVTTQVVSGQTYPLGGASFLEPRIKASVMMSPSPPAAGDPAKAFSSIKVPCLLMTGTGDTSPIGNTSAEDRLKVFPALSNAPAWQVVFDKGVHMTFGERDLLGAAPKDPRYHRAILALTTAFWDAELKNDKDAKAWLNGEGAKSVLIPADKWEKNGKATL
ncbi:hypothetical protein KBB96_14715 [Luteolibacter ambystomatis]|uniref:Dienelactone hydrolase n=1 Tax=Luteolibacter ambystomatis TaxID=2824561 RepID=A0A975IZS6_9BACT|nr:hypothetical protein [Luteolibacter ambystomatis]QUE50115.1 hypothetical protein KBB96_14715 [Luteolibacter ambystomatis]